MKTHMEEIPEIVRAEPFAPTLWFQVAKYLHADDCKPHEEHQHEEDHNEQAHPVTDDAGEESPHLGDQAECTQQAERLQSMRRGGGGGVSTRGNAGLNIFSHLV